MERKLSKSPFTEKELGFLNGAFNNATFKTKDLLIVTSLKNTIANKFVEFAPPDIHAMKQIIDNSIIKGADAQLVVDIVNKLGDLLKPPKAKVKTKVEPKKK